MQTVLLEFFTISQLAKRYSVCPLTIRRWVAAEMFPQPLRISPRRALWPVAIVAAFEASKTPATTSNTTLPNQKIEAAL